MTTPFKPLQPKVVMGIVAHPDDLEFGMAGTIAQYVQQGATAYYYILTNGNKGSEDRSLSPDQLRDMRREEQRQAARILGVSDVIFSDYDDGTLQVSMDVKRDIVRAIRTYQPEVVMTMDPTMTYDVERGFINHPDHRAAGQSVLDAVFPLARDHLSFPELLTEEQLEPHKVSTVLLVNFEKRNFFVDVTATMDRKIQALAAHASQISDIAKTEAFVKQIAQEAGAHSGYKYCEAFVRIDIA